MKRTRSARSNTSLIVATTQRCGATWLASLMESTGSLGHPEEWLLPGTVLSWGLRHRVPILKVRSIPECVLYRTGIRTDRELYAVYRDAVNPKAMQRYLDRLSRVETTPNSVFSIHLQWDHFEVLQDQWDGSILDLAEQNRWLFLWREDQLEQTISWVRARATNQWTSSQRARDVANYDGPELRRRFLMTVERNQQWAEFFRREGIEPHELTYEQVQADPNRSIGEILEWIGERSARPVVIEQRGLDVQRSPETEEWILRFTEENPDLIGQRFRPRGGADHP